MEIKKLKISRQKAQCRRNPIGSFGLLRIFTILLLPVASGILCTPASTAPVEHVFSASGEVTRGKRNRLSGDNLERETLLRKNLTCFKVQSIMLPCIH